MSLLGALNVANTALAVQQAALQVTGNNVANAGDPTYTREVATTAPAQDEQLTPGIFVGTGVDLLSVQRQVDEALNTRLRGATSDQYAASTSANWAGQIQSSFDELNGQGLSTMLSNFYGSWSSLANSPTDPGLRQTVIDSGQQVASQFNSLDSQLTTIATNAGQEITTQTANLNTLTGQIANLNAQISQAETGGQGQASSLRDQRDADLMSLSQLANVTTQTQTDGTVSVYLGSQTLVSGNQSRALTANQQIVNGAALDTVTFSDNGGAAAITGGQIGGLIGAQTQAASTLAQVNTLASAVISEVNQVYSSGQGTTGFTTATATNAVTDSTQPLNTPNNGLTQLPTNGSFVVHVTDQTTGLSTSTLVQVDLNGQPGQTTLNSLATSLGAISNVSASIVGGKLSIQAAPGTQITFSQDSSGVLASLGINTFFTGSDASNIAVNSVVQNNPAFLAAAQNGDPGDNQTALALANIGAQTTSLLNGQSIQSNYQSMIEQVGATASAATNNATATAAIANTLTSQQQSVSGVSENEEAINLIQQQRAFQAAARLVSTVDSMMQTLLAIT